MASQQVEQEFIELKEAGKINSELDAYMEGKIAAMNEETEKTIQEIKERLEKMK